MEHIADWNALVAVAVEARKSGVDLVNFAPNVRALAYARFVDDVAAAEKAEAKKAGKKSAD